MVYFEFNELAFVFKRLVEVPQIINKQGFVSQLCILQLGAVWEVIVELLVFNDFVLKEPVV